MRNLLMLASIDGLTGIANRRALDEKFTQEWKRAVRLGSPLALIMIDVDHFKGFNDRYGHVRRPLPAPGRGPVSRQHSGAPRIWPHALAAREFAVVLPHTDHAGTEYIATKILSAIYDLEIEHDASPWKYVTVSVGSANLTPTLAMDKGELLQAADLALYEAKRAGRNCVKSNAPVSVDTVESPD